MKNKKILKIINDDSAIDLAMRYALVGYDKTEMLSNVCPEMRSYIRELVNCGIRNYQRTLRNRFLDQIESKYIPKTKDETIPF